MAEKTWTAVGLRLGKLVIYPEELVEGSGVIKVERRYRFLDAQGDVLDQIAGGRVVEVVPWADLPQDIKDALQAINAWTKQRALEQEGME